MNKISVSIIYNKQYNIKSFYCFDGSVHTDYTIESLENTFLSNLIDKYDSIVVFDIKQFLKLYSYRNINLRDPQIIKIECVKLAHHLKDSNNKNIEITDVFEDDNLTSYYKRIETFKKIYKEDRYLDLVSDYILTNYNLTVCKALYDYKIDVYNKHYYDDLKCSIYRLGICEQNGIKCLSNSIKNIDGFIYPDYEYDSTSTGRLQNRYPVNLQNLAKDDEIRKKPKMITSY